MTEMLKKLCSLYGVSGREEAVREYIISKISSDCEYSVDNLGNLLVLKKGRKKPKNTVMLAAHMDEIGFVVTHITDDGLLKFDNVGGIDTSVMLGRSVRAGERLVPGVIGVKPVHLLKDDEKKEFPERESLYIDIGAKSRAEAEEYILPGDCAYFDSDFVSFGDGLIKARALDDRAGCAVMLRMLGDEFEYDTWFAFTTQEETGTGGAQAAAYTINPAYAIVLEATTAADIAGVEGEKRVCALGGGPVISFMDKRTVYSRELYGAAFELAKVNGIKAQTKTQVAGGNDAGAIFKSRGGVKVLAVSLPCRYLHSPSCVINEPDLDETYRLVKLLAEDFSIR